MTEPKGDVFGRGPRNVGPMLKSAFTNVAKLGGHVVALPVRALARTRPPAVEDPRGLHPGDAPPTDGRLLLLYDGGCGICLHARDVFATWDRRGRLEHDRIARHDGGLLSAMPEDERYGSWHVVHPDGRVENGSRGVASALAQLPGGKLPSAVIRRFPDAADAGYQWFAANRSWISQGTGLIEHPQRDPREQPGDPHHLEVVI